MEQSNADLGAYVVHAQFVENTVAQVVCKRIGLLEDLVKLGTREAHSIGEVRREYALAR